MEKPLIQYEFINSQTGNVVGYLSIEVNIDQHERDERLKQKQTEIAIANKIYIALVYWRIAE